MQKSRIIVGSRVQLTKIGRDFDYIYENREYIVSKHYGELVVFSDEDCNGSYLPVDGSRGIYWELVEPTTNKIGGKINASS